MFRGTFEERTNEREVRHPSKNRKSPLLHPKPDAHTQCLDSSHRGPPHTCTRTKACGFSMRGSNLIHGKLLPRIFIFRSLSFFFFTSKLEPPTSSSHADFFHCVPPCVCTHRSAVQNLLKGNLRFAKRVEKNAIFTATSMFACFAVYVRRFILILRCFFFKNFVKWKKILLSSYAVSFFVKKKYDLFASI